MPHRIRSIWLVAAALSALAPAPASAQFVESRVRAHSLDDHEPLLDLNEDCDPRPPQDPENPGVVDCTCNVAGGGFGPDEKCIDDHLFRFTNVPGDRIAAGSFACDVDRCGFSGGPPNHGLGIAESDMGLNFVHAFSEDWLLIPSESYYVEDAGGAFSLWSDDLSFTTAVPNLVGSTLRTIFRVRGSWQGRACFNVLAGTSTVSETPGGGSGVVSFGNRDDVFSGATLCLGVLGGPPPPGFTDYNAESGSIDLAIPIEIPLAVPSTVRLFGQLKAWANGDDSFVTGPSGGLAMTIERIDVPLGVNVTSAAGALGVYNVPEPGAAAGAAIALGALLALRRRGSAREQRSRRARDAFGVQAEARPDRLRVAVLDDAVESVRRIERHVRERAEREHRHLVVVAQQLRFADRHRLPVRVDRHAGAVAARVAHRGRTRVLDRGLPHVVQLVLVLRRHHDHVGQRAQVGHVEAALVRRAIGADQARAIEREGRVQILHAHVVPHLIDGALQEGRVDRRDRLHAFAREAGREGGDVLLGGSAAALRITPDSTSKGVTPWYGNGSASAGA